jgi:hypothetical protein
MRKFVLIPVALICLGSMAAPALSQATQTKVPTGYSGKPQYKPREISYTGDGSGWFGGSTGNGVEPSSAVLHLGRLKWTTYTHNSAVATGVDWGKFGPQATVSESFRMDGAITLRFSDPANGNFSRMMVVEHFFKDEQRYITGTWQYSYIAHGSSFWQETRRKKLSTTATPANRACGSGTSVTKQDGIQFVDFSVTNVSCAVAAHTASAWWDAKVGPGTFDGWQFRNSGSFADAATKGDERFAFDFSGVD